VGKRFLLPTTLTLLAFLKYQILPLINSPQNEVGGNPLTITSDGEALFQPFLVPTLRVGMHASTLRVLPKKTEKQHLIYSHPSLQDVERPVPAV
jgi:hypothetical protein